MKRSNPALLFGAIVVIIIAAVVGVILATNDTAKPDTKMNMTQDSNKSDQTTENDKAVSTDTVTIQDFAFSPANITVKVGTKVTWTNQDSVGHTVTVDEGEGPDSQLLAKGESYSFTFTKAGSFSYHCTPHPNMQGTVVVTN